MNYRDLLDKLQNAPDISTQAFIRDIRKIKRLSSQAVVAYLHNLNNSESKQKLIIDSIPNVLYFARVMSKDAKTLTLLDLINEGIIGAIVAIDNCKIKTFSRYQLYINGFIKSYILRALLNHDRLIKLPGRVLLLKRRYEKVVKSFYLYNEFLPSAENIQDIYDCPAVVFNILKDFGELSLYKEENANDINFEDIPLSSIEDDIIQDMDKEKRNTLLKNFLALVYGETQCDAIQEYYFENIGNLSRISDKLFLSRERIRQLISDFSKIYKTIPGLWGLFSKVFIMPISEHEFRILHPENRNVTSDLRIYKKNISNIPDRNSKEYRFTLRWNQTLNILESSGFISYSLLNCISPEDANKIYADLVSAGICKEIKDGTLIINSKSTEKNNDRNVDRIYKSLWDYPVKMASLTACSNLNKQNSDNSKAEVGDLINWEPSGGIGIVKEIKKKYGITTLVIETKERKG